ncbi:MAG: DUF805 domain-containing protein [Alphaproteobacteria bacterium]|nr:MAG: DUF805 domain-containing protein [Alphaproteobacteria bacterium]TMJ72333.1 MAG: DUF805 domain-containing protein [Alphaproteobacteria bacterium]TMJ84353.1 MAG: DUF805 domain-containing protein [Alphaproteobacteria bacterium]TMJ94943.1 MAG: DUF805 domain-containing protein [Alphaproteobacteria bacterium]TMK00680.1 MAG: DUF805 domain-containing protein [Alphaproteobacteria bacterium]
MSMKQLLFSFRGRLNRKRYWMTVIVTMAVIILLLLLALVMMREQRFEFAALTVVILLLLYIPLIWIGLAIGAKRLHDRDKSAWWLLVFYVLPGILSSLGNQMDDLGFLILHVVSFAITVWAFVELGCLRGTLGPNQYGPDPLSNPT